MVLIGIAIDLVDSWDEGRKRLRNAGVVFGWLFVAGLLLILAMKGVEQWQRGDWAPEGTGRALYTVEALLLLCLIVGAYFGYRERIETIGGAVMRVGSPVLTGLLTVALLGYMVNSAFYSIGLAVQDCKPSYWTFLVGRTPPVADVTWVGDPAKSPFPTKTEVVQTPRPTKKQVVTLDVCQPLMSQSIDPDRPKADLVARMLFLGGTTSGSQYVFYSESTKTVYRIKADQVNLAIIPKKR
jgi:hypothetical protein